MFHHAGNFSAIIGTELIADEMQEDTSFDFEGNLPQFSTV
jgi:hypothetical protein